MKHTDQLNELATALSKAQALIAEAEKDGQNPHFKSRYSTLSSVWAACRHALSSNGLSVVQHPFTPADSLVGITTRLLHSSGQWIEESMILKPVKTDPQGVGSAITYGKRYGLMAMVGVTSSEDDDDGNQASSRPHPGWVKKDEPKAQPKQASFPPGEPWPPAPEPIPNDPDDIDSFLFKDGEPVTKKDLDLLVGLLPQTKGKWSPPKITETIKTRFGKDKASLLTRDEYNKLLKQVQADIEVK